MIIGRPIVKDVTSNGKKKRGVGDVIKTEGTQESLRWVDTV